MNRMKLVIACALAAVLTLSGCASGGTNTIQPVNPQLQRAVSIVRMVARAAVVIELQKRGMPPEVSTAILAEVDPIIDQMLAGQNPQLTGAAWAIFRTTLVTNLTTAITKHATSGGLPLLDPAMAKLLAEGLVDSIHLTVHSPAQAQAPLASYPICSHKGQKDCITNLALGIGDGVGYNRRESAGIVVGGFLAFITGH